MMVIVIAAISRPTLLLVLLALDAPDAFALSLPLELDAFSPGAPKDAGRWPGSFFSPVVVAVAVLAKDEEDEEEGPK